MNRQDAVTKWAAQGYRTVRGSRRAIQMERRRWFRPTEHVRLELQPDESVTEQPGIRTCHVCEAAVPPGWLSCPECKVGPIRP